MSKKIECKLFFLRWHDHGVIIFARHDSETAKDENQMKYDKYASYAKQMPNLLHVGRHAEYKYYDMDDIVARALEVFEDIISQ